MAGSPSHKFGQIIGDILELAMTPYLQKFADDFGLYLDTIGNRPARKGKKVTWVDTYGNKHDLDFVIEKGGTDKTIGTPVAFIESAWRRYTKHSRNKAQEIQSAILPLAFTHNQAAPFLGVILAGVFTDGAIKQLISRNFKVLYFEYDSVVQAFSDFGIDASFDEDTPVDEFTAKIESWENCNKKNEVIERLVELNQDKVDSFFEALEGCVLRVIDRVSIFPLFGSAQIFKTAKDAISFITDFKQEADNEMEFVRFEVQIEYSNGDNIKASFAEGEQAKEFLQLYEAPELYPEQ